MLICFCCLVVQIFLFHVIIYKLCANNYICKLVFKLYSSLREDLHFFLLDSGDYCTSGRPYLFLAYPYLFNITTQNGGI
jgi:hypothetical protein